MAVIKRDEDWYDAVGKDLRRWEDELKDIENGKTIQQNIPKEVKQETTETK